MLVVVIILLNFNLEATEDDGSCEYEEEGSLGTISGYKWEDLDSDGEWDEDESDQRVSRVHGSVFGRLVLYGLYESS